MERNKRRRNPAIIESGDEFDDDSNEDSNWVPVWVPDESEKNPENDTSSPEALDFNTTEGFQLKTIKSLKQSNLAVWAYFGQLMRNGKPADRVTNRVYCIACFDNKKFKR